MKSNSRFGVINVDTPEDAYKEMIKRNEQKVLFSEALHVLIQISLKAGATNGDIALELQGTRDRIISGEF